MRTRHNGRSGKRFPGPVIVLPKAVFCSDEYRALSHRARALLLTLHLTYNGRDNGSLRILFNRPRDYGFSGRQQLEMARNELVIGGWIEVTRPGSREHVPTYYAMTWIEVNANDNAGIRARPASGLWRKEREAERDTLALSVPPRRARQCPKHGDKTVTSYGNVPAPIVPSYGSRRSASLPPDGTIRGTNDDLTLPPNGNALYVLP